MDAHVKLGRCCFGLGPLGYHSLSVSVTFASRLTDGRAGIC